MTSITVRIRSQLGIWRAENVKVTQLFSELRTHLEKEHKTEIISSFSLSPRYANDILVYIIFSQINNYIVT